MKNPGAGRLIAITAVFAAFTLGILLGRSTRRDRVVVSVAREYLTAPTASETVPETTAETVHYPLDINTATQEELQTLPGIGEILAQRVVAYRREHGFFASPRDLLQIQGIGDALYQRIEPYVTVLR